MSEADILAVGLHVDPIDPNIRQVITVVTAREPKAGEPDYELHLMRALAICKRPALTWHALTIVTGSVVTKPFQNF